MCLRDRTVMAKVNEEQDQNTVYPSFKPIDGSNTVKAKIQAKSTSNSITISWDEVKIATSYEKEIN